MMDHMERAKRKVEIPLVIEAIQRDLQNDISAWEQKEKDRVECNINQRKKDVEHRDRLERMREDKTDFIVTLLKKRNAEFKESMVKFNKMAEQERAIRLEKRKMQRIDERRQKYFKEKEEEEQRRKDEELRRTTEEKARKEAERKAREEEEYQRKKEALDRMEEKKKQREKETEEKSRSEREENLNKKGDTEREIYNGKDEPQGWRSNRESDNRDKNKGEIKEEPKSWRSAVVRDDQEKEDNRPWRPSGVWRGRERNDRDGEKDVERKRNYSGGMMGQWRTPRETNDREGEGRSDREQRKVDTWGTPRE